MAGCLYVELLLRKQVDEISVFMGIVDIAFVVFLADEIKMLIPCNLIIVMLALKQEAKNMLQAKLVLIS